MTGGGSANGLEPGDHAARVGPAHPDKPVALFDGGRLTYAELDALSDRFAVGLRRAGMRPGDAVALQLPNIPQFLDRVLRHPQGRLRRRAAERPAQGARDRLPASATRGPGCWSPGPGSPTRRPKGAADAGLRRVYVRRHARAFPRPTSAGRSRSCSPPAPDAPPLRPDRPRRHRGDRLHVRHDGHARRAPS